ncbi:MAG: transglutaminase domain-containing protein [Rhodopirellula sp.]|nr:transglutaminase domain-containing protein [Rhodopirellula sp.]
MNDQTLEQLPQGNSGSLKLASILLATVMRIPLQRWLALAIIALEAFTLGYLSQEPIYPAIVIAVAIYGTTSRLRFEMDRQRTYDIIALMGVVFVMKYMATPDNPRYQDLFSSQRIAFSLAQYVLAMQCVQFFLKRRDDQLPFSFPGIGVVALVCTTMVSLQGDERSVVLALCIGFAILSVLYCDASRRFIEVVPARHRGRPIATVLVIVAVGGLGWFTASTMYRYERHVEAFVNQFLKDKSETSSVGFSESSTLEAISLKKDVNSQQTVLRVVSTVEPGYFRARIYDTYKHRKWRFNTVGRATHPVSTIPTALTLCSHVGQAFQISDGIGAGTQTFEVWPDADLGDTFAAPLRTSWLCADATIVTVDTHEVMRSSDAISGVPYTLLVRNARQPATGTPASQQPDVPGTSEPKTDGKFNKLKQLATPPGWALKSKRLTKLASALFENCDTVDDKLTATIRYFKENYTYSLKVAAPTHPLHEPLEWFLLEQPPAHCEYFASGAAVLLRMAGVPCRYVVGFVISEKNPYSGEWVARNEDAHAWVEAYDETRGWLIVDTTPAAGIPDDTSTSAWTQLYEYLRDEFHRLRVNWQQHGVSALITSINNFSGSPLGIGLITIATLTAAGVFLWRRRRRNRKSQSTRTTLSPTIARLQTARQKLDLALKRIWRVRLPGETVDQYAQQLASGPYGQHDPLNQAADWYARYAALRFSAEPDPSTVNEIADLVDQLAVDLRKRPKDVDNIAANR